jgi:hypothetical protein
MRLTLATSFIFLCCAPRASPSREPPSFPRTGAFILSPAGASGVLRQCSRTTPKSVAAFWVPSAQDVERLEARLSSALASRAAEGSVVPPGGHYNRQYIGVVRNGVRLVYANVYDADAATTADQNEHGVVVCDGGPRFWGVVFNPTTGEFSDFSFNGGL